MKKQIVDDIFEQKEQLNLTPLQKRIKLLLDNGGTEYLLNYLKVNPKKGLDHYNNIDLDQRKKKFGVNIHEKHSKNKLL